ncbi:hypothetical protein HKCCE3408_15580 [Rhodobacterales bacterium HKCCE3408]|nr:hypothetical protein [Rhodobacterales bacterium HKCCE3408]
MPADMIEPTGPRDGPASAASARLRIMATTDLHARLRPYDYLADAEVPGCGLAVLATLISTLRTEEPNALLFDNGDTFEGSPLADFAAGGTGPHPIAAAMNAVGYDAGTLGNHDFNFGLEPIERAVGQLHFPVVLTNVRRASGEEFLPRSTILTRHIRDTAGAVHLLRIGIVGLAPPQLIDWDWSLLHGRLLAEPIVPAAAAEMQRLRDDEGVDLVIALCHSGIDRLAGPDEGENAVMPLAATGLADAIVAGHTHMIFPGGDIAGARGIDSDAGTVHAVPTVQPGFGGQHLGLIDLRLDRAAGGRWRVTGSESRVLSGADTRPAPQILRLSDGAHAATRTQLDREIGHTDDRLFSYFDLMAHCRIPRLVSAAKRAAAIRALDGRSEAELPVLTTAGPTRAFWPTGDGTHTDIPPGPLRIRDCFTLYAYANRLAVLKLTGAGLRAWLHHSARIFRQIVPGETGQWLIDTTVPGYGFDVIDGVSYRIDVTVPAKGAQGESRIRDLSVDGRPVADDDEFLLATNSYRAGGGGGHVAAAGAEIVVAGQEPIRDVLIEFIGQNGTALPATAPAWRFASAGGTAVIAETGVGAFGHLDRAEEIGARPIGLSNSGGALFEMTL